MKHSHGLLACAFLLTACSAPEPARPAPTVEQPTVPDEAESPSKLVGRLLLEAIEDGTIERAMGTTVAVERPREAWITTRSCEVKAEGFTITTRAVLVSTKPDLSYEVEDRFDSKGAYLGKRTTSRLPGLPNSVITIDGANALIVESRPNGADETTHLPWGENYVSAGVLFEIMPCLFDRGLPPLLRCSTIWRDALGYTPADVVLRSEVNDPVCVVRIEELEPAPIEVHVGVAGPRLGQVLQRVHSDGPPRVTLEPGEAEAFRANLPRQRNEWAAVLALYDLRQAQHVTSVMRPGEIEPGPFAPSLEALREQLTEDLASGESRGYVFSLLRSEQEPTKRWLAVASPAEPGVSGRFWYAINHEGTPCESDEPFELDPSCEIPTSARRLE